MRVVYEKSITDKVLEARRDAREADEKISHIAITKAEWYEIHKGTKVLYSPLASADHNHIWWRVKWVMTEPGQPLGTFCGIRICKGDES